MRSFWSDPYLWIHLAGLAALPVWLELCFLGLAVGDPIFSIWLELAFVEIVGIVPILWMQWQRPFYIFSLLAIALKPESLTLPQRQLLTRFKSLPNRLLAVVVAILWAIMLRQLYVFAPIGAAAVPFSIESHGLGLLVAAIAFLGSHLFLQVPVSVASVMLTSDFAFANTEPYPVAQIAQDFTSLGLPVSQLLPEFLGDSAASRITETKDRVEAKNATPEELMGEIEEIAAVAAVAAIADMNEETAPSPTVNIATESDREVEHDLAEDWDAIARIDEQPAAEMTSAEMTSAKMTSAEAIETTSDSLE